MIVNECQSDFRLLPPTRFRTMYVYHREVQALGARAPCIRLGICWIAIDWSNVELRPHARLQGKGVGGCGRVEIVEKAHHALIIRDRSPHFCSEWLGILQAQVSKGSVPNPARHMCFFYIAAQQRIVKFHTGALAPLGGAKALPLRRAIQVFFEQQSGHPAFGSAVSGSSMRTHLERHRGKLLRTAMPR